VDSLPKTVTQQRRGCDLNLGPTAPESSTLTTRLPSHLMMITVHKQVGVQLPTSADNVTLLAVAAERRPCGNQSISPARRAHSSKPARAVYSDR